MENGHVMVNGVPVSYEMDVCFCLCSGCALLLQNLPRGHIQKPQRDMPSGAISSQLPR